MPFFICIKGRRKHDVLFLLQTIVHGVLGTVLNPAMNTVTCVGCVANMIHYGVLEKGTKTVADQYLFGSSIPNLQIKIIAVLK